MPIMSSATDNPGSAVANSTGSTYSLNASNLVVSGFASLLILLLTMFALGLMYICAKLRRQGSADSDIGDTGWVHNSFQRQSMSAAAATASMYRQGGALSWDSCHDNEEQRRLDLSHAVLELDRRPTFFSVGSAAGTTPTATSSVAASGAAVVPTNAIRNSEFQQPRRPSMAFGPAAIGNLVPAGLPNLQPAGMPEDQQPYDQLQLNRLALSGPFVNEHAVSCDSLAEDDLPPPNSEFQSDEYLDVHLKK
ncbi:hypothetical protein BOX15_Mlig017801g3 [Macrostomum lignano]|uniref:Uncharacterized protein n=2 Tax=Macrostomum lignano TaxID=282301 RepID=A0A267GQZ3_9PLAT|nr:hypothetical protein BOX15_Mlig017801g4 [Macrostomum lignano]PAA88423.1 hypothetical protein BOX15_Mlig017801g3 [Macrostomum lignano]